MQSRATGSEIWFRCPHDCGLDINLDAGIAIHLASVGGSDGTFRYIVASSNSPDLIAFLAPLDLTISLLLRRRASHLALRAGPKLSLNLAALVRSISFGPLVGAAFMQQAAQALLDYLREEESWKVPRIFSSKGTAIQEHWRSGC